MDRINNRRLTSIRDANCEQTLARASTPTTCLKSHLRFCVPAHSGRTGSHKILNNLNQNKNRGYSYDALGRLTQYWRPTGTPL